MPWDGFYGGDAVVCRGPRNEITKAYLYDYYERDVLNADHPGFFDPRLSDQQFVSAIADKLEALSPDVFLAFRREAGKLATYLRAGKRPSHPDFIFQKKLRIDQIPDQGPRRVLYLSRDCKVEQLVIRYKRYNRVTYYIQSDVFQKLSAKDRRGLILHEALYHSFNLFYGDTDSARSRFFNRGLIARPLRQLSTSYLEDLLKRAYAFF